MDSVLPEALFDGQEFVDSFKIKWVYNQKEDVWIRVGKVDLLPIANGTNVGLLPSRLKFLIDSLPEKAGGFALITQRVLSKRSSSNPDGVLFGDVEIISDTLDIQCVDSDGNKIGDACKKVAFKEYDELPPGFDFNLSELLLETLCVEVPGGPGPIGLDGIPGEDGVDGTGDGPIGLQGDKGRDATTRSKLTGVKIVDVDDIFDVAVVKMELDAPSGKLYVTKGRVATPDGDDSPATQLVVSQIARTMNFKDCWDYELIRVPCRADDDFDILDPLIASYPENFDPNSVDGTTAYPMIRTRLSNLIGQIIVSYKEKLDKQAEIYDKQIADFMQVKDAEARKVLDELGDRLAQCENITYLEYCVGIEGECNLPPAPPAQLAPDQQTSADRDCGALIDFLKCTDKDNSTCRTITSSVSVRGSQSPVLAIATPPPGGAYSQLPPVFGNLTPDQLMAAFNPFYAALQAAIANSYIVYHKSQIGYSDTTLEFPAGTYCFIYQSGAFRQQRRSVAEQGGTNPLDFINGAFQDYFVGNEGDGSKGPNPFCLIASGEPTGCLVTPGPFYNTGIGLEVGFASKDYVSGIPSDYFDRFKFDLAKESGQAINELPNTRVDFAGLSASQRAMEDKIAWTAFPAISGPHSDGGDLENSYKGSTLDKKMVVITTTAPGFFFVRCRPATCWLDSTGVFVMPPVTLASSIRPGIPTRDSSFNKIYLRRQQDYRSAYVNAKPFAEGEVKLKVVQVDCQNLSTGSAGVSQGTAT